MRLLPSGEAASFVVDNGGGLLKFDAKRGQMRGLIGSEGKRGPVCAQNFSHEHKPESAVGIFGREKGSEYTA